MGFLALWIFFVFETSASELLVGAAAAALSVLAAIVSLRSAPACFEPKAGWLLEAWRLPGMIAGDLVQLSKHLARQMVRAPSRSSWSRVNFLPAAGECRAAAQRTLAVLLVTTTPNSVVVNIDSEKGELLLHQAQAGKPPTVIQKLQE